MALLTFDRALGSVRGDKQPHVLLGNGPLGWPWPSPASPPINTRVVHDR